MTERADTNARVMARWFTDGWRGDDALADEIFVPNFSNNGVVVGPAGPKRNVHNRIAGAPTPAPTSASRRPASGSTYVP
jgi:hypothetical protein